MNIKAIRWFIVLVMNLFCAFAGGRIVRILGSWKMSVALFCSSILLVYLLGSWFKDPIMRFRSPGSSPRSKGFVRGATWGSYGVILLISFLMIMKQKNPDPGIPVFANFGILLIFASTHGQTTDIWRNIVHCGVFLVVTLCYTGEGRLPAVTFFLCLLVTASVFLHYEEQLEEAGFFQHSQVKTASIFAASLCMYIVLFSVGFSYFSGPSPAALAYRNTEAGAAPANLFTNSNRGATKTSDDTPGKKGQSNFTARIIKIGVLISVLLSILTLIYIIVRFARKKKEESSTEDEGKKEEGIGTRVTVQDIAEMQESASRFPYSFTEQQKEIIQQYVDFMDRVDERGTLREDSETPSEVLQKLSDYSQDIQNMFQEITALFERVRYGNETVEEEDVQTMKEKSQEILRQVSK